MANTLPIVVIISGQGTNLQAIIDAVDSYNLPVSIEAVISNKAQAYGLERAKKAKIPTDVILYEDFQDRHQYDEELYKKIVSYSPQIILLAGYMRILGPKIVQGFKHRIINIHPSLLPLYPGLTTHQQVINNKDGLHGCSIHIVTEDLDSGPLIAQGIIKVDLTDTAETLKVKVAQAEHFLYPMVLNWLAHNRLKFVDDKIFFDSTQLPSNGLSFFVKQH